MDSKKFINLVTSGQALEAKEFLNDLLSSRAFESLDAKKVEIAQTLYNNGEEIEVQDTTDTSMEDELLTQEEFDALSEEDQELYLESLEQIDEVSKTTLRNYIKGVKRENDPRIHGDSAGSGNQMSNKARSLGRTEQDKEDSRYEGQKLAKRKLGVPGTIPAKVMAK